MRVVRFTAAFALVIAITACGGGGGGSPSDSGPTSSDAIGNMKFVYDIIKEYTDRYTIDGKTKSDEKTSEDTDMYIGYDADSSLGLKIAVAWYPSRSQYLAVAETALNNTYWTYDFSITGTGGLRGCFRMMLGDALFNCYALKDVSQRFPLDVWARTGFSRSAPGDRLSEIKTLEREGGGAARSTVGIEKFMELAAALDEAGR